MARRLSACLWHSEMESGGMRARYAAALEAGRRASRWSGPPGSMKVICHTSGFCLRRRCGGRIIRLVQNAEEKRAWQLSTTSPVPGCS